MSNSSAERQGRAKSAVRRASPRRMKKAQTHRPRYQRVKSAVTYDVQQAAKLLDVHVNTVRRWLKDGLDTIDSTRPILIHGATLKAYLRDRSAKRRKTCGPGEFFCFGCREPRPAWDGLIETDPLPGNRVNASAFCAKCHGPMRQVRRAQKIVS
jgi:hypothetical protein